MRYLTGGRPADDTEQRFRRAFELYPSGYGYWSIEAAGEFVGWVCLTPAEPGVGYVGYRLAANSWGHGYATEAARRVIAHAFAELELDRVLATTMTVNVGSRRVLEKNGLRYVRTFFDEWPEPIEGGEQGDVEYAITRAEWAALTGS